MKKRNLKQTTILLNKSLNEAGNSLYTQWYLMSLKIIDSEMLKPSSQVKKEKHHLKIFAKSFLTKNVLRKINNL